MRRNQNFEKFWKWPTSLSFSIFGYFFFAFPFSLFLFFFLQWLTFYWASLRLKIFQGSSRSVMGGTGVNGLYCARKTLLLLSCTNFFQLWFFYLWWTHFSLYLKILLIEDVERQSGNHKYRWFSIVQFTKLNNLDGANVKVWFNKNGKEILENLLKLNFHVLRKLKRINLVTFVTFKLFY